jgi:hypothetical protein
MTERFANNASSALSSGIGASDTTLTVNAPGAFPSSGNFRLIIDSEYILVTGVAGAVFTITRGIEGSTAASHLAFATVTHIVTAGALLQAQSESPILSPPGTPISTSQAIGPTDTFKLIQPSLTPYTITMGAIVAGLIYRQLTVPGSLGGFAANPATISRGSNGFTIEDPQNRSAATANTQILQTDNVCYEWMLDSTNNVLRCMRQVQ